MSNTTLSYQNPILPGFHPDPSIIRVDDDYYMVTSSFEYFPALPLFHSRDLIHWRPIGHAMTRLSQLDLRARKSSQGIYAPTLRYHAGRFYIITTDVYGIGNFYIHAEHPTGPWSEPIRIPYGNIDPSLFFDDDGKVYVTVHRGSDLEAHIIQYEINIETGEALTEPVKIWQGNDIWTEGPHLYKMRGMYYIMSACGGTGPGHHEIIGRSQHPYGPFEPCPTPILSHRHTDSPIQCLGHADLVEDTSGNWWAVFLGVRPTDTGHSVLGRETFLAPVEWSADGWPMIDNDQDLVKPGMQVSRPPSASTNTADDRARSLSGSTSVESENPAVAACENPVAESADPFAGDTLPLTWGFIRNPVEESWSLSARPGWLTVYGQSTTLSDAAQVAFVGHCLQHKHCTIQVNVEFQPTDEGEEAGLALRMNESAHYEFALRRNQNKTELIVRLTSGGTSEVVYAAEADPSAIQTLQLQLEEETVTFAHMSSDTDAIRAATAEMRLLSPEVAGGFTGLYVGVYATGNGHRSATPAYFQKFQTVL